MKNRLALTVVVLGLVAATAYAWTERYETKSTPWSIKYETDAGADAHVINTFIHTGSIPSRASAQEIASLAVSIAKQMKKSAWPKKSILSYVWFFSSSTDETSERMVKMGDGSNCMVLDVKADKLLTYKKWESWKKANEGDK